MRPAMPKGLFAAALISLSCAALAQQVTTPAPDNSANNQPARAGGQVTADDQSNSKSDIDLTQRIRRSVLEDKNLSIYGQNVKIVSADGKVTLTGVVRTEEEKKQIGMKATAAAGDANVTNQLKVAPAN